MSQTLEQNLLALAQQGDPNAIATLIDRVTSKKGVTATAKSKGTCLHIVLTSDRVPDRDSCVRFVHEGIARLNPESIESVRVYGRRNDQKWPSWTELLELNQPVNSSSPALATPSPKKIRKPAKLQSKSMKKIPLLSIVGICSIFIAAAGIAVKAKMDTKVPATSAQQTSKTAAKPQPSHHTTPRLGVVPPPPGTNTAPELASENTATDITIKAVGDIVPGSNFPNNRLPSNNRVLFQNVKPLLQGADILFGNFESTLTNYPRTAKDTSRRMVHAFRNPPSYANLLKETGFNVLSIANNHSLDFFPAGFADTAANIENAGMTPVGKKNEVAYVNVKDIRVAFIGFSHLELHNTVNDIPSLKALVIEAEKNADIVVVSFHGGAEGTDAMHVRNRAENFYGENRGNLVLFSHTAIDNGADLVLGHGPHVVRAMELYKGKLIAYSLGNFVGYRSLSTQGVLAHSLVLDVKLDAKGDFVSGKILPVQLDRVGIPYPDRQSRSVRLIRNLTQMDFPNTPLKIDSNGLISKQSQS